MTLALGDRSPLDPHYRKARRRTPVWVEALLTVTAMAAFTAWLVFAGTR
ncbi:MAG TPA: hypothetical protein VIN56_10160 [Candidatus Dormibacteraeota bacterium]|jgi:hypothetical protein